MNRKFLEDLGLQKDDIDKIMVENGKDINREKEKVSNLQAQLDTVNSKLQTLGNVDVNELNNKISTLQTELANNKSDYEKKIADRDFNDLLAKKAVEFKVRDVRTVKPFLDIDSLKASKNQESDVEKALKALSDDEEKSYLFNNDKQITQITSSTSGINENANTQAKEFNSALRSLFA